MDDKQSKDFMQKIDTVMEQRLREFRQDIKNDIQQDRLNLHAKIDKILDMVDTDEKERLFLAKQTERQLNNHERRLTALELATQ